MANDRITQEPVEALVAPDPLARMTQEPVEVLATGDPVPRMTQEPVEVLKTTVNETVIVTIMD